MRRSDPAPLPPSADDQLETVRSLAFEHGITHFGVADAGVLDRARHELHRRRDVGWHDGMQFTYRNPDRSTDPDAAVRGARSILVGALPYLVDDRLDEPLDEPLDDRSAADGPGSAGAARPLGRVARYAWVDHHAPLRAGLWAVAQHLRQAGWKAVAYADDNSIVDREVAHRAGLGWFGKNSNLLVAGAGSWFVLGCVITTAPFTPVAAPVADGCGSCRRCIDGCPTGAIVADGVIDASRCLSWLLQKPGVFDPRFRLALGDRIYGCDDCQEVCPPTVHLGERVRRSVPGPQQRTVDLLDLLEGEDATVLATCGRWYIDGRDPRWLRRNALVVLANVVRDGGRPGREVLDDRITAVIARYLADRDPILRCHAVWAAGEVGLRHLVPQHDDDPLVQAELARLAGPAPLTGAGEQR